MNLRTYNTQKEAQRAIDLIQLKLGSYETLRLPDGTLKEVLRKPWCTPVPLQNGKWGVPIKPILQSKMNVDILEGTPLTFGRNERHLFLGTPTKSVLSLKKLIGYGMLVVSGLAGLGWILDSIMN